MSDQDLDERLARMRAELKSRGTLQQKQQSGEPWAYSLSEAATALSLPLSAVKRLVSTGALHAEQLSEPMIPAVTLRTFLSRHRRR
jgi:hypothetical protein